MVIVFLPRELHNQKSIVKSKDMSGKTAIWCHSHSKMAWTFFLLGVHQCSKDGRATRQQFLWLVDDVVEDICNLDTAFSRCRDDTPLGCH